MTAERLITRPYGALELKQSYQQGLVLGLLAAALLHLGALWGLTEYGGLTGEDPVAAPALRKYDEGIVHISPYVPIEPPAYVPPEGQTLEKLIQPLTVTQPTPGGTIKMVGDDTPIAEAFTPTEDEPKGPTGEPVTPGGPGTGPGSILGIDVGVVPALPELGTFVFVTRDPEPLPNQPQPMYSEMARLMELQGTITLSLLVSDSGDVLEVVPLNKEGTVPELLVVLATEAARKWKFIPALQYDRHVSVWYNQNFRFTLK